MPLHTHPRHTTDWNHKHTPVSMSARPGLRQIHMNSQTFSLTISNCYAVSYMCREGHTHTHTHTHNWNTHNNIHRHAIKLGCMISLVDLKTFMSLYMYMYTAARSVLELLRNAKSRTGNAQIIASVTCKYLWVWVIREWILEWRNSTHTWNRWLQVQSQ